MALLSQPVLPAFLGVDVLGSVVLPSTVGFTDESCGAPEEVDPVRASRVTEFHLALRKGKPALDKPRERTRFERVLAKRA